MTGIRAEMLKWRRRPEIVATVVAIIGIATLGWLAGFSSASSVVVASSGQADFQAEQVALFLAPYRFPASIVWILTSGLWLNLGVFYLAAATTGGEYVWATIRNVLINVPRRTEYLGARFAFLALLGLFLVLAEGLLGAILPSLVGSEAGLLVSPASSDPAAVVSALLAALLGVLLYGAAGTFLAILFRDRAAPLIVGTLAVLVQTLVSPLPVWAGGGVLLWIPRLFPANALGTLFLASEKQAGLIAPDTVLPPYLSGPWPISLALCVLWIGALISGSVGLLWRSDITE